MSPPTADLVIYGATVLDGGGGPALPDTTVVMRDGRICGSHEPRGGGWFP